MSSFPQHQQQPLSLYSSNLNCNRPEVDAMPASVAQQLEQLVLQSANTGDPSAQWHATQRLQDLVNNGFGTCSAGTNCSTAPCNVADATSTNTSTNANANANGSNLLLADAFLDLLQQTSHAQVQLYALSQLSRWSRNRNGNRMRPATRAALRSKLLSASSSVSSVSFLRNKAALILVQHLCTDVPKAARAANGIGIGNGGENGTGNNIDEGVQYLWHAEAATNQLLQLVAGNSNDNDVLLFLKTMDTLLEDFFSNRAIVNGDNGDGNGSGGNDLGVNRASVQQTKEILRTPYTFSTTTASTATTTLMERLLDGVVQILAQSLLSSSSSSCSQQQEQIQVLALSCIKGFLMWTELEHLFLSDSAKEQNVLELLMMALVPSSSSAASTATTPATQLAALDAWQEYILPSSSSPSDPATNNMIKEKNELVVQIALLERLHAQDILPYQGESLVVTIEVVIQVAQLINTIGLEMIPPWQKQGAIDGLEDEKAVISPQADEINRLRSTLFHEVLDLFFRAFAYDDIDVSAGVLPLAGRLCLLMEEQQQELQNQNNASAAAQTILREQMLPQLLNALYCQLKFPLDFIFDRSGDGSNNDEDDDDVAAEEELYRSQLLKLFATKLVRTAPDVTLQFVAEATAQVLQQQQQQQQQPPPQASASASLWTDAQATLRLVYHYCEGIRPSPGLKVVMRNETFCRMLVALHGGSNNNNNNVDHNNSTTNNEPLSTGTPVFVSSHQHPQVLLQYYQVAVRYYPIFQRDDDWCDGPLLMSNFLESLTGPLGLQHPTSAQVRSQCCYLLLRLVKHMGTRLRPTVATAVAGIQGLLMAQRQHALTAAASSNQQQQFLRPDDALHLFETTGLLLGKTGLDSDDQRRFLVEVLAPHIQSTEGTLRRIQAHAQQASPPHTSNGAADNEGGDSSNNKDDEENVQLSYDIAAMAHLSKGFSRQPSEPVQAVLMEMLPVTCAVLEFAPHSESVRSKSMILLQRMIYCLDRKVLGIPQLPGMLYLWIEHCTVEDILFVSQVLNVLCKKFQQQSVSILDGALLPFLRKCQSLVPAPPLPTETAGSIGDDGNHTNDENAIAKTNNNNNANVLLPPQLRTEQLAIQKLAFVVLQHIVTHRATAVLISPTNAPHLETVLQTEQEGATRAPDPVVKRTCLRFFRDLVDQWLDDDHKGSSAAGNGAYNDAVPTIYRTGLMNFVCQQFVPGMVESMLDNSFDESDAMQARVVSEFAAFLFILQSKETKRQPPTCAVLAGLHGRVPHHILEAMRVSSSEKQMGACLSEIWKTLKRRENSS